MTGAHRTAGGSASAALAACGAYQVGIGAYFIFWRPSLLPEDLRFLEGSGDALRTAAPGLEQWLQWVFTVMGGQMVAVGMLVLLVAVRLRSGAAVSRLDIILLVGAAASSALLMCGINFAINSDFRLALLIPVAAWLAALFLVSRATPR
jgi:hypothetical protein